MVHFKWSHTAKPCQCYRVRSEKPLTHNNSYEKHQRQQILRWRVGESDLPAECVHCHVQNAHFSRKIIYKLPRQSTANARGKEKKQSIETVSEEARMLDLVDKDFKSAVLNMVKDWGAWVA